MRIWIDADACPKAIKEIICRAAQRVQIMSYFVANQLLLLPSSSYLKAIQVKAGFDQADQYIVTQVQSNDLVITADIPLAAQVVAKNAFALNPRGMLYTVDNMHEIHALRDLMTTLRDSGTILSKTEPFSHSDRRAFAQQFDRLLTRHHDLNA